MDPQATRSPWRFRLHPAGWAALVVLLTAGYFQNCRPGWNVNTQLALTCAIVERGTLSIDAYHERPDFLTMDKAYFQGRFYSDKSPVLSFLGVPAYAVFYEGARRGFWPLDANRARYWVTWTTVGGSAAALAALLALLLARHGASPRISALLAAGWIAATPLLGYSTLYFNYLPACAFALGGWLLVEPFWTPRASEPGGRAGPRGVWGRLLGGGVLVGLASWTLPTMASLALLMTAGLAWGSVRERGADSTGARPISAARRILAHLLPWAVGGVIGASGFAIYSWALFGEITTPYRFEYDENFRASMAQGLMGARWPDLRVLALTTFHPFRGLFTLFPTTAIAWLGAVGGLRLGRRTSLAIALAFLLALLLYNAGYYMWWGGWAYAPRHLIPSLPFLALGLVEWLGSPGRRGYFARACGLGAVMIAGGLMNAAAVAVDPQPPPGLPEAALRAPETVADWPLPFIELIGQAIRGEIEPNWGKTLGLPGLASLLPLVLLWVAFVIAGLRRRLTTQAGG